MQAPTVNDMAAPGSGTAVWRSWKPFTCAPLPEMAGELKTIAWLVAFAVNVPIANWPRPPTAALTLSESDTVFVAVAEC